MSGEFYATDGSADSGLRRIRVTVVGPGQTGLLEVVLGSGYGVKDGGVTVEIPEDWAPPASREIGSRLVVVLDEATLRIIGVEPDTRPDETR